MFTVDSFCRSRFSKLGYFVGSNPKKCIIISVTVSFILGLGMLRLNYISDVDILFPLRNGNSKNEVKLINKYFPANTTDKFSISRMTEFGRFIRILVQRKDGDSIVNSESWSEIMELDRFVQNVSVEYNGKVFNYSNLCASWKGTCHENKHLDLRLIIPQIENGSLRFNYPVMFNPVNFDSYPINLLFGGFTFINGTTTIDSVKAISLSYFARIDSAEDKEIGLKWETIMLDQMAAMKSQWKTIKLSYVTVESQSSESEKNIQGVMPYFVLSITLMVLFIIISSYTGNWVTSKCLVLGMGLVSVALGVLASAGVLIIFGLPMIGMFNAVLFVGLGVGVDDTFVMMAAWRKTSSSDSVSERLAHCYAEAGISITITTLTDMLSFYVGILSPVPNMQIFCAYAGTAILFIYFWHLIFFGANMALFGTFEKENRHSLFPWKILPVQPVNAHSTEENASLFFKNTFSPFLFKPFTKICVAVVYLAYIAISLWGVSQMKEGLDSSRLAHRNSHFFDFHQTFDTYFREYPYRAQLVVTTPLDYSKKENRDKVLDFIGKVTALDGMTSEFSENWLTDFMRFNENYVEFYNFSISTEQEFIDVLRTHFLYDSSIYSNDISFNDNFTKIMATRYVLQYKNVADERVEQKILSNVRYLTESEKAINFTMHQPLNKFTEISLSLRSMTIMLVSLAAVIVMTVTITFIPNLVSTALVFMSVASVELGVVGFMVLWNINLDIISVITLMMCIGFSVDFPAHLTYAYLSSQYDTVEERVQDAMQSLGWPIVLGAASTIIAVSGIMLVDSYIFEVFFKIVCLVMTFSLFNALFLLPVFLTVVKPSSDPMFSKKGKYNVTTLHTK